MESRVYRVPFDAAPTPVHAVETGSGEGILFLHGWARSARIWEGVVGPGIDGYRTVAVDLPGFGKTPPLPGPLVHLDDYARFLRAVLHEAFPGGAIPVLAADSMGAVLALRMLAREASPNAVLLSGAPAEGLPRRVRPLALRGALSSFGRVLRRSPPRVAARLMRWASWPTLATLAHFDDVLVEATLQMDLHAAETLYRELCRPTELPPRANAPRWRILRGRRDRIVSRAAAERLAARLGADFVELDGSGHTPALEEPDEYRRALLEMLG